MIHVEFYCTRRAYENFMRIMLVKIFCFRAVCLLQQQADAFCSIRIFDFFRYRCCTFYLQLLSKFTDFVLAVYFHHRKVVQASTLTVIVVFVFIYIHTHTQREGDRIILWHCFVSLFFVCAVNRFNICPKRVECIYIYMFACVTKFVTTCWIRSAT